jgi:PAS domain S-box-containing protein
VTSHAPFGEEPIRHLTNTNIIGMVYWDIHGRLIDANEEFCRIAGYSRQEFQSGTIRYAALTPPEFRRRDLRALKELRENGTVMPYEKELVRPDGTRARVMIGGTFFTGSSEHGVAFVLDMARRAHPQSQPDREERYRMAAEAAKDAILILDEDGIMTYANPAAERTFGYPPAELFGRGVELLIPVHHSGDGPSLRQCLRNGHAHVTWDHIEASALHRDGHRMLLEISLGKFGHSGRKLFAAIVRDVTERKKTQFICEGQNRLLEMIALGATVEVVLEKLILLIESQTPGMLGSVLLLDEDGVHVRHGAAPNLPLDYIQAIDGEPIGPAAGSCGTAMYTGKAVVVSDILADPLWANYRIAATQ